MRTLTDGLKAGSGFGLAVTAVSFWLGALNMMSMRMPPITGAMVNAGAASLALGALLGILASPVLRLARGGRPLHLLAMIVAWLSLEYSVALDPGKVPMWATGAVAGGLLTALGRLVARRFPRTPLVVGIAALASAFLVPIVVAALRSTDPVVASTVAAPEGAPDVLVVVIDTVRADHLSTLGYERETSPRLSRLAAEGTLFTDATSPSTWSLPSHASLFTGLYPSGHGTHAESRFLREEALTMAEAFARSGYDTACFTANPHISDSFSLTQGFAYQDRAWAAGGGGRSFMFINRLLDAVGQGAFDKGGALVTDNFARWTAGRSGDARPAFVFVNFLEAHFPYHQLPPDYLHAFTDLTDSDLREQSLVTLAAQFGRRLDAETTAAAAEPARDMYDGGVLYTDMLVGRLLDALEEAGRLDRTVVVVLADHGELLGEYGIYGHGMSLHQEDLHVPLVVRYPGKVPAGLRVERPVSTVGVFATVADLAGIAVPEGLHGGSLFAPDAEEDPVLAERFIWDESRTTDLDRLAINTRYRVYREGPLKLAVTSAGEAYLFDLAGEGEALDLAQSQPELLARAMSGLRRAEAKLGLPPIGAVLVEGAAPVLDDAARERLEALGYMD